MGRLQDRVAVVTGAGEGIGAAIARRFALEGARVVIAEIDEALGRATAEALAANPATTRASCPPTSGARPTTRR